MDFVKVKRGELLETVQYNRDQHHNEWVKAYEGYRVACIGALKTNLDAFQARKSERITINEAPPEDHTRDYDRVVRMLEMSTEAEITLSAEAFSQYVMDEWHWKHSWSVSNAKYLGR